MIIDFGLSKDASNALGTASVVGAFKGTLAYSAPEVAVGSQNVTKATDVYALGVIVYEVALYDCSLFANGIITVLYCLLCVGTRNVVIHQSMHLM